MGLSRTWTSNTRPLTRQRKVRGEKRLQTSGKTRVDDGVTTRDGAGRGQSVGQLSTASLSVYLKPRAAFCGLAPSLPTKPIRTSNGGKEKTVKCGLESVEIKLVRIVLTRTHHCSVQPLGNQEDVPNLRVF